MSTKDDIVPITPAVEPKPAIAFDNGVSSAIDHSSCPTSGDKAPTVHVARDDEVDERDLPKRQEYRGKTLLWLAYQAVGVIYGDIGTSPLYVFSSTFTENPSHDDLLGALSLIIWTLTLIVSVKYVLIVLFADDEGEGGTFALYSLLSRYGACVFKANIVRRDPREETTIRMERVMTGQMRRSSRNTRTILERSQVLKTLLKIIGVFGVSLVMSDGVLTPAQSVLGAIQGLRVADESISTPTIIGVSCTILVLLFLIEPFGTSKLGTTFAPIVIIWLLFNVAFGIYNLIRYDASVLKAFSPYFAGLYLQRNRTEGWKSLGGILLCFTGCEALFADLGAFSRNSIRLSWLCFGYPCLLLAYIGQAAYIARHPEAYSNPFFEAVPPGMFYPSLVVAVLAAIVASQTMITATFQLLSQIIKLSYFPQIKVVHTSKTFHKQIYNPWVNWLLMIGTVAVTAIYNNTTRLGQAYGVCVILVTFLTTCLVTLVALVIWGLPIWLVLPLALIFLLLDGTYLSAALVKIPEGAWFTLALSLLLSSVFILWRFGKENQWRAERGDRLALGELIVQRSAVPSGGSKATGREEGVQNEEVENEETELHFSPSFFSPSSPNLTSTAITRLKGLGIFFDKSGHAPYAPAVFLHFLQKFHAIPAVVVFFTMRPLSIPSVPLEERFHVSHCYASGSGVSSREEGEREGGDRVPLRDFYRVVVRHGYLDEPVVTPELGAKIHDQVRAFIIRSTVLPAAPAPTSPTTDTTADTTRKLQALTAQRLAHLSQASDSQILNIIGKEQLRIEEGKCCPGVGRRVLLEAYLWLRAQTGTRVKNMEVEVERVVEVGFVKVM